MDDDGADIVGQVREAIADRQDDTVIERVAFGRTIEADSQDRAGLRDRQQFGLRRWRGIGGVSHVIYVPGGIVITYNYLRWSQ
jgi:hypothetical protein